MTLEEAIAVADTWKHDPDLWMRDLSAKLDLCINAGLEPAGRYLKRQWIWDQPDFPLAAEAVEIIETMGLGNFGGPPPIPDPHYWAPGARIAGADDAFPIPPDWEPPPEEEGTSARRLTRSPPDFSTRYGPA